MKEVNVGIGCIVIYSFLILLGIAVVAVFVPDLYVLALATGGGMIATTLVSLEYIDYVRTRNLL